MNGEVGHQVNQRAQHDPEALRRVKVTAATRVSVESRAGEPLKSSLSRMLRSVNLSYHVADGLLQIRASHRDRLTEVMGKGSDSAAARKMITDERSTLDRLH